MITGDQPLTAKSIAAEVGIEEYVPRAKPEDKFEIVGREQSESKVVAMIGDGTIDAAARSLADVGLAEDSVTEAAKEGANMVDLESNPGKIIDVVMLGKQLLMTRGAVTAFSIANDVAKYFAIMPVIFASSIPQLQSLNILGLGLRTAVLSALIFNAIIIPLLIPLAMRGVTYQANGELVQLNGRTVGSSLIAENFTLPIFFFARNNSASGVDPDITVQDAYSQIPRISNASGIPIAALRSLVDSNTEGTLWIFGSPYENVLKLNLFLISNYS